jgi:tetratricopeptide (TPR) repeat protein
LTEISPFAKQLAAGRRCLRIGDVACAIEEASDVLGYDPANHDALSLRAGAYNRSGKPALALADADAVLKDKPGDVVALLERGYALYQLGKFQEALSDVEAALKTDPLNAMGHLYRGMILEKISRASDAIAAYVKAADLDPGLKPLVDEALARLGGAPAAPGAPEGRLPSNGRLALYGGLAFLALAFLIKGVKRAVNPDLATPLTPLR